MFLASIEVEIYREKCGTSERGRVRGFRNFELRTSCRAYLVHIRSNRHVPTH
jgi:hypothetical protein